MESIQKIRDFADAHSDGIEEADELEKTLNMLLECITSYCCNMGSGVCFSAKVGAVEVNAVKTIEECLSVRIKTADKKLQALFNSGTPGNEVKASFLRFLGESGEASK